MGCKENAKWLEAAVDSDVGRMRQALLEGADATCEDHSGMSALEIAARRGAFDAMAVALDGKRSQAQIAQALEIAARQGHRLCMRKLLQTGADADSADRQGRTPLMAAALLGQVESARELLAWGASIDQKDKEGATALMRAAQAGQLPMVQALLAAGADPLSLDHAGRSALMHACSVKGQSCVGALLQAGVPVDGQDRNGNTALLLAARFRAFEALRELVDAGAGLDHQNHDGATALILAAANGEEPMALWLMEKGSDAEIRDTQGMGAQEWADQRQWRDLSTLIERQRLKRQTQPGAAPSARRL